MRSFLFASFAAAMTPLGLVPSNTENMTAFFNTSVLAVNGAHITQIGSSFLHINMYCLIFFMVADLSSSSGAVNAPTMALDKTISGLTFMIVMTDPDAIGLGSNGSSSFLHWMQDGLTSASTHVTVQGKTVVPLLNSGNVTAIASYFVSTVTISHLVKQVKNEEY